MQCDIPRLVIAAPMSGSGKTTVTVGLLAALSARGKKVCSFKIGISLPPSKMRTI